MTACKSAMCQHRKSPKRPVGRLLASSSRFSIMLLTDEYKRWAEHHRLLKEQEPHQNAPSSPKALRYLPVLRERTGLI